MPLLADVETRLVQGQSIGYEGIDEKLPPGTTFANASSVHETSTAELAVGLAIAAQRHFADFVRAQDAGRWAPVFANSLADRRVLLLGYGGVGKAIAARLAPFEVDITAVASRARTEDGIPVHGIDELHDLLPHAEIVMLSLPGRRRHPARSSTPRRCRRCPTARCWSTSAAARSSTPTPSSPKADASGPPSMSPTPSRSPRTTRSGACPAC